MAKFRTNHQRSNRNESGGWLIKVGLFGGILVALFATFNKFLGGELPAVGEEIPSAQYNYLPTGHSGKTYYYKNFVLNYNDKHEQANWVAYLLRGEDLRRPWGERIRDFRSDRNIRAGTATDDDYRGSGYDRGHLVPVADMLWDAESASETFYFSNISPQAHNFNNGVWRELEELTRTWAKIDDELYVVSGPVLTVEDKGTIGSNEVTIPAAYFKVLLDIKGQLKKGIGFVIPNAISFDPLTEYAVTIDEVEALTGLDFFGALLSEEEEEELERTYNLDFWRFSKKKYELRTDHWNQHRNPHQVPN